MTPKETERTYRIGEVAKLLELETYVLRFWESEFTHLAPLRTLKGQRIYTAQHIEQLRQVQHLLYDQGFTIEGARRVIEENLPVEEQEDAPLDAKLYPEQGLLLPLPKPNIRPLTQQQPSGKQKEATTDLRIALRDIQQELFDIQRVLRAHRAQSSSGELS